MISIMIIITTTIIKHNNDNNNDNTAGERGQHLPQEVVLAALHDEARLRGLVHDLQPVLVDLRELLRLHGHLLRDVAAREDGLQGGPHLLHLEPALDGVRGVGELREHLQELLLEGYGVALRVHGVEHHLGLLEGLLDLADLRADHDAEHLARLPGGEVEGPRGPLRTDVRDLLLEDELLVGRLADVQDLVLYTYLLMYMCKTKQNN